MIYLGTTLFLLLAAFAIFRIFVRRDYRLRGKLTPISSFLQLLLFFMHAMSAYIYMDPYFSEIDQGSPLFIPAILSVVVGVLLLTIAMSRLGTGDIMGVKVSGLRQSGLYRFTRNPQIVAGFLAFVGFALLWPTWAGLIWLGVLAAIYHLMVLTEEEHLQRTLGMNMNATKRKRRGILDFDTLGKYDYVSCAGIGWKRSACSPHRECVEALANVSDSFMRLPKIVG